MIRFFALSAALALASCTPTDSPTGPISSTDSFACDTCGRISYSIEDGYPGRILIANWYHTSFSSPLASTTLAERPFGQTFEVSAAKGSVALPSRPDSIFEFWARFGRYAATEANGKIRSSLADSAPILESSHWAMAPLLVAGTTAIADMKFSQAQSGAPDTSIRNSGYILLWVRDSLDAGADPILKRRKLTSRFTKGWHILEYIEADRSLVPANISDTIRFKKTAPEPNLV